MEKKVSLYLKIVCNATAWLLILSQVPWRASLAFNLGMLYYSRIKLVDLDEDSVTKSFIRAEKSFLDTLDMRPTYLPVYSYLDKLYLSIHNLDALSEALARYERRPTSKQHGDIFYFLCKSLRYDSINVSRLNEALEACKLALTLNSYKTVEVTTSQVSLTLADIYEKLANFSEATRIYENEIGTLLHTDLAATIHYNIGWLYQIQNNLPLARQNFMFAAKLAGLSSSAVDNALNNAIKNGGFELGRSFWTMGTYPPAQTFVETCQGADEKFCWHLIYDGTQAFNYYQTAQDVPVFPATRYKISYQIRTETLAGFAYLVLVDAEQSIIAQTSSVTGTSAWKEISKTFDTGADTHLIRLRIIADNTIETPASVWIDNIRLELLK